MQENMKKWITLGRTILGAALTAGGVIWASVAANPPDVETMQTLLTQLAEQLTAGVVLVGGILATAKGLKDAYWGEQTIVVEGLRLTAMRLELASQHTILRTKRVENGYEDGPLEVGGEGSTGLADDLTVTNGPG